MTAWAKAQDIEGSNLTFLADTSCLMTKALGVEMIHPGPLGVLGTIRCKRFAMFVDDGVIKVINVSEGPTDPAGDVNPLSSCCDNMLKDIAVLNKQYEKARFSTSMFPDCYDARWAEAIIRHPTR